MLGKGCGSLYKAPKKEDRRGRLRGEGDKIKFFILDLKEGKLSEINIIRPMIFLSGFINDRKLSTLQT